MTFIRVYYTLHCRHATAVWNHSGVTEMAAGQTLQRLKLVSHTAEPRALSCHGLPCLALPCANYNIHSLPIITLPHASWLSGPRGLMARNRTAKPRVPPPTVSSEDACGTYLRQFLTVLIHHQLRAVVRSFTC